METIKLDFSKSHVNMVCDDPNKMGNVIMSVSSFLNQKLRGEIDGYECFILGSNFNLEYFKEQIPPQFISRMITELEKQNIDKFVILYSKNDNILFGTIDICITKISLINDLHGINIEEEIKNI